MSAQDPNTAAAPPPQDGRFARLARYEGLADILPDWQASSCAVIGLGGLGCAVAPYLARLGVRRLSLIDRDVVSPENLGHQTLFSEAQAASAMPKASAAATVLAQSNSAVELDPRVAELSRHNIRDLLAGSTLLFDGLDNYYTRLLVNDYAFASGTPFLYAGVVSGELSARALIPGHSGCLRCLVDVPPAPGSIPTCSTAGVFPPLLGLAALLQLELAGRWLRFSAAGPPASSGVWPDTLFGFDMQSLRLRSLPAPLRPDCPVCSRPPGQGRYDFLDGVYDERAASACDGSRQQLELGRPLDLPRLAAQLEAAGGFVLRSGPLSLSAERDGLRYTLFPEGRMVLEGSLEPADLNRFLDTYLGG